ncbi:SusC/RagA family TonB-linked outer membrane protein [uncultured Roseivirga sp.]|uniref:SusC/RagA family TonB-linked outer membrane protein n=1 Tax=uncultured Roseivirga sp. TaxID=543088 RepID=UPI0030DCF1F3
MKRILLNCLMLTMLLTTVAMQAQDKTVSGKVTGGDDGLPLPQVSVFLKGNPTSGVPTDFDGNYRLTVPQSGGVLVFRYLGYITQEQVIGSQTTLNVIMQPEVTSLEEFVVTGYGVEKKREITGSISSLGGEKIENLPLQSFDRALQGRAAGVLVQSANGVPGGAMRVRIRGQGSLNAGNDPLYIVDGVQVNNSSDASNISTNPLASINPNDIESLEILKDAAASIYGSQAANGVVLITTKKGKEGKTKLNFNAYSGWVTPVREVDMMNTQEFINYRLEQRRNYYTRFPTINQDEAEGLSRRNALSGISSTQFPGLALGNVALGQLPQADFDAFVNGLETYDWQGEIFSNVGRIANYELSASGGNSNTRFYISGSYNKQEGQIKKFDFERGTLRMNLDTDVTDRLTIETKLNLSTIGQSGTVLSGSAFENPTFAGLLVLPFNPIFDATETTGFNEPLAGILAENPVKSLSLNERTTTTNQVIANMAFNYQISDALRFRSYYGIDYRMLSENRYTDPRSFGGRNVDGSAYAGLTENINFITTQQFNYDWNLNSDNKFNFLLAAEYRQEVNQGFSANAQTFPTPQFRTIASAAEPTAAGGFYTTWRNAGVFTNVKYNLKDKYFLNGTLRYDGSSRFGVDQRWGLFPSIGASWLITEESFLPSSNFLTELKLRASYGTAGNNRIGNFDSRGLVSSAGAGNYLNLPGLTISGLANNRLSWETQTTLNLGLDFVFYEGRISGSFEAYRRRSTDLLLDRSLPQTSGYGSISENVGELDNRGIEIGLNTVNIDNGDFSWKTSFNIAFQGQELLSLFPGETNNGAATQVGQPLNLWYNWDWAGVNPANGRPFYYDNKGNLTYNPQSGSTIGDENDDRKILGNTNSSFFGGLSNTVSYKGLTLDFMIQYDYGKDGTDGTGGFSYNPYEARLNLYGRTGDLVWRNPGDVTSFPRPNITAELGAIGVGTARALQDLSYIRLKQVTLSYNLPSNLLNKMFLDNAKVYVQGINLLTFTNYTGLDPEFTGGSQTGIFPPSKNFTVGVQFGF